MSKQLEHIIKKFLMEQRRAKLTTSATTLNPAGVKFIKTEVCPKLGIDPVNVDKMDRIYGLRVIIDRKGEVTPTGDMSDISNYDDDQLQKDVLTYLDNSIGGVWARNKSTGWFWFISKDLEASKNNKDEKKRARYSVICTYVNASLIQQTKRLKINSSTNGWIKTFKQGGLVFELDSIISSEWIVKIGDQSKDPNDLERPAYIDDKGNVIIPKGAESKQGIRVLDLPPDKITNDLLTSIIVPAGGFKIGLENDNEFYKAQVLMLRILETTADETGQTAVNTQQYKRLKSALQDASLRGDYWKSPDKNLGATQSVVAMIKFHFQSQKEWNGDTDPNIVTTSFIDFLKSKI